MKPKSISNRPKNRFLKEKIINKTFRESNMDKAICDKSHVILKGNVANRKKA